MDLDYWLRIALVYKTGYLPKPLSVAKIYQYAKSSAFMFKYVKEYEYILEKLFGTPGISLEILQQKNNAYNFVFTKGGLDYFHAKMMREGLKYIWKAFRISPVTCIKNMATLIVRSVLSRNSTGNYPILPY
jgi:hypothetical protein